MKKPETKLWEKIYRWMSKYHIRMKRIENVAGAGTPDVYYDSYHRSGWIELKQIKTRPKRKSTPIKIPFRPGQYAWVRDHLKYSLHPNIYLLLQLEEKIFLLHNENIQTSYYWDQLIQISDAIMWGKDQGKQLFEKLAGGKLFYDERYKKQDSTV